MHTFKAKMSPFYDNESLCQYSFERLGPCWHVWTNENFETLFRNDEDFKAAMALFAMSCMLFPGLKILTFELMNNHLHIAVAGREEEIRELFECFKRMLRTYFRKEGVLVNLKDFQCNLRLLESLSDCRNTIIYINRNGYVARSDHSPITYPWGANSCFFNSVSFYVYKTADKRMKCRDRMALAHTHQVDSLKNVIMVEDVVTPWCFCSIRDAESMFRGPAHYFYSLSKNIEANKQIASEIGENVYYTDDELFGVVTSLASRKYSTQVRFLSRDAKIEMAKTMHYEYNASNKQVARLLKLDVSVVGCLFPELAGR